MTPTQKDRLFTLIEEHCHNAAVKRVLDRHRKDDKEIRVSGAGTDLLSHLRRANERGTVTDGELLQLLRAAEENGRQHILFYTPKDEAVRSRCNDGLEMAKTIFAGKTPEEMKLPKFFLDLKGVEPAEFRIESVKGSNYSSWTFKVYSGTERAKFLLQKELGGDRFAREYQRYRAREVLLVKWHSFGLLELRASTYDTSSKASFRQDVENLWRMVSPAFGPNDFDDMNLTKARSRLVEEAADHEKEYYVGNAVYPDDKGGNVRLNLADADDVLHASKQRCAILKNLTDCKQLVVTWKNPRNDPALPDKLRVEIGSYFPHEIRIGGQTTPEAVTYVTRRLFDLSR